MTKITLVPTGRVFNAEAHESVLAAALRAGLNLPHSCKAGHCASCRARILSGRIEYPGPLPPGISQDEADAGYALLCQCRALADLQVETREVRAAPDVEVKSLPCRIDRLDRLAEDVMALFLRLPAVEDLPHRAGQYVDILLPGGQRRSFSIASAPADGRVLELHVRRASASGFTAQLFTSLHPGALLRIEGPLGQFWFREDSTQPAILVGGGTGYAPLRAMLRQLLAGGLRRPLELYWGGRTQADLYEDAWLRKVAASHPQFRYHPVLSAPDASSRDAGTRSGLAHEIVLEDHPDLSGFDAYASGPPGMVEAVRAEFPRHGLPRDRLFFDSFDFAPDTLEKLRATGID
jgi:CDP-4-dehydro-6-deoxyglucose reductase